MAGILGAESAAEFELWLSVDGSNQAIVNGNSKFIGKKAGKSLGLVETAPVLTGVVQWHGHDLPARSPIFFDQLN